MLFFSIFYLNFVVSIFAEEILVFFCLFYVTNVEVKFSHVVQGHQSEILNINSNCFPIIVDGDNFQYLISHGIVFLNFFYVNYFGGIDNISEKLVYFNYDLKECLTFNFVLIMTLYGVGFNGAHEITIEFKTKNI